MAKKIQKKQIEDGVFVETKSTYTPPTQDSEYVQKKYVDEEVAKKANVSHTHSWDDITDKPGVTSIPSAYTTEFRIGDIGSVIVPKLPSWVSDVKPSYNWNEIGNKPNLDFLPLGGGTITPTMYGNHQEGIRINRANNNWSVLTLGTQGNAGVREGEYALARNADGNFVLRTGVGGNMKDIIVSNENLTVFTNIVRANEGFEVGNGGNKLKLFSDGAILIKDKTQIVVRDNGDIAFGNKPFNDLVYGEFKGIKLWGQSNEGVVLAGGGVANLLELKNDNIKVGGRNLILNSKEKRTMNGYMGVFYLLAEPTKANEQYIFSCLANIKGVTHIYFSDELGGVPRQYINVGLRSGKTTNLIVPNKEWRGISIYQEVAGITPVPVSSVELIKLELGNKVTDWSPAFEDFNFYKGNIQLSDLNAFKNRETGGFSVNTGGGWGAYLNFKLDGSTSSLEFFKKNWYPSTRIGVRNSVDSGRFNDDGGAFRELAWYSDVYGAGAAISSNWTAIIEHQNNTIFVENSLNVELGQLQNMGSISFIKTFDGGNVTFTCVGKTIKYPFDNQFNGKDGSTAVATIYGNKCYIRISNV